MNKQTETALKMAMRGIESMFNAPDSTLFAPDWLKIYNACKEALEQPAQEPAALSKLLHQVIHGDFNGDNTDDLRLALEARSELLNLTRPAPAREPLSQSKKDELVTEWLHLDGSNPHTLIASIERAHGIGE